MKWNLTTVDQPKFLRPAVLLHMPIPVMLHGVNPRLVLGTRWWNRVRKEAYKINGGFCLACGASGRMDAHEQYDFDYVKHISKFKNVIPLCRQCHQYIHYLALPYDYQKKILIRGNEILHKAGLKIEQCKAWYAEETYPKEHLQDSYTHEVMMAMYVLSWKLDLSVIRTKTAREAARKNEGIIHDDTES